MSMKRVTWTCADSDPSSEFEFGFSTPTVLCSGSLWSFSRNFKNDKDSR
jgi:hypothetical protein